MGQIVQAVFNDQVVAKADKKDLIFIEGKWYFPPESVNKSLLEKSDTPYNCFWKGDCQYYNVRTGEQMSKDAAFTYPEVYASAVEKVKKDFSGYYAFWRDVQIKEE